MVSIQCVLAQIKADLAAVFSEEHLTQICRAAGARWRERTLTPVTTIYVFLLQVLHGNTAMTDLPRLSGTVFTPSAYCQARQRLPVAALRRLLHETGRPRAVDRNASGEPTAGRWRGHRTWGVDGSSCSMPDTPALRKKFGLPPGQKCGCGFPVAHLLVLFDVANGGLLDILISPWRTNDFRRVAELHDWLQPDDVLIADRGFCSYTHVAQLHQRGVHVVFRLRAPHSVNFRPHRPAAARGRLRTRRLARCGPRDQLVLWQRPDYISRMQTAREHAQRPAELIVRELSYRVRTPGFRTRLVTLVTTLLNPAAYPAEALAELYRGRWQVETNLRHLKQTLGLAVLHSQTVAGVEKEILVFGLVYNLVQSRRATAAAQQQVPHEHISFLDAWRQLRWPLRTTAPPDLWVNPERPHRYEPRYRKRRPPSYPLMTRPRAVLRREMQHRNDAA
jgi:hypothetical protein